MNYWNNTIIYPSIPPARACNTHFSRRQRVAPLSFCAGHRSTWQSRVWSPLGWGIPGCSPRWTAGRGRLSARAVPGACPASPSRARWSWAVALAVDVVLVVVDSLCVIVDLAGELERVLRDIREWEASGRWGVCRWEKWETPPWLIRTGIGEAM